MSQYPEHDKLSKVMDKSQMIGEFLDWLREGRRKPIHLAETDDFGDLTLANTTIQKLLAEYFKIDEERLEGEKRAMLALIRDPSMKSVDHVE